MTFPRIASTANPQVKAFAALKNRRERDRTARFLVEGFRELRRAVASGVAVETVLFCPEIADKERLEYATTMAGSAVSVVELSREALAKVSQRQHPDGLIGVAVHFDTSLERLRVSSPGLVLIVEGIEKPGNLGAMMRTADAAGVDGVIAADPGTDPFNPNVIRASQGAVFSVPLAVEAAEGVIEWVTRHDMRLVAATPEAEKSLWDADLSGPIALVVGAEHAGLSPAFRTGVSRVRIPMRGSADSLNAATAAAILLYEVLRRRS